MSAINTLFPVFFMLALGYLSRIKGWISPEQKAGANAIVFTVLFPIMIFNLILTAKLQASTISVVLYAFIVYLLAIVVGKLTSNLTGKNRSHFSPFLLTTNEGGSVALPLYLSIVGASSNTVIFDLAGSAIAFFVLPVIVARQVATQSSTKDMIKGIFSNSFVIAVILGLIANFIHLYGILEASPFLDLYTGVIEKATGSIVGIILFVLGYDLSIDKETVMPIVKLASVRVVFYGLAILGFFLLFPSLMDDKEFKIAAILYFMCPTGFALPSIISPVFKNGKDEVFASTFISLYMVVTLIVYTLLVVFVA